MSVFDNTDVLFSYRAGGSLSEATFSRASKACYRDRTGTLSTASSTGVTRLEWSDVDGDGYWEQPGLLIEGARTNGLTQSEAFNSNDWTKTGAALSANTGTAPDGSTTADTFAESTSTGSHDVYQTSTGASENTLQAASVFAKAGTRKWIALRPRNLAGTLPATYFNLETGAIGTQSTGHTAWIEPYRDGWYRCMVSADSSSGSTEMRMFVSIASTDGTLSYGGSTANNVQLWGAQFEVDGAFPTSYIPTSTVAVARSADTLTYPFRFAVQDLTVYARIVRPPIADLVGIGKGELTIVRIGTALPLLQVFHRGHELRQIMARVDTVGTDTIALQSEPSGNPIEACAQFRNLKTGGQARLDVGSGFGSWSSATPTTFHSFGNTTLQFGGANQPEGSAINVKIARGLKTLSEMRDLRG